jgi:hypothetical protein
MRLAVGEEQRFRISYSTLLRAMTSPFVSRCFINENVPSRLPAIQTTASGVWAAANNRLLPLSGPAG